MVSTALFANSLAVTALAAICVAVTVSLTNFAPVIVAFAISPFTIVPSAICVDVILPLLSKYAFVTTSWALTGSATLDNL